MSTKRKSNFQQLIQERRALLVELCNRCPRDTVELSEASGNLRDTVKNDLTALEKSGLLVKLGRVRTSRRGGSETTLWAVPGGYKPHTHTLSRFIKRPPEYAFKTRWVTVNPYNPEPQL